MKLFKKIYFWFKTKIIKKKIDEVSLKEAMIMDDPDRWTTVSTLDRMKNYKDPYVGQKFFCEEKDECYVYVGDKKFVQIHTTLE